MTLEEAEDMLAAFTAHLEFCKRELELWPDSDSHKARMSYAQSRVDAAQKVIARLGDRKDR